MSQVWVVGEALIDWFLDAPEPRAIVGGGPANTARALAKLGLEVQFIDGISIDQFGCLVVEELSRSGVKLNHVKYFNLPTSLALISLNKSGFPAYKFLFEGTATFGFESKWLPETKYLEDSILYIGSLASIIQPGANALFDWAQTISESTTLVFDPNIRPAILNDKVRYKTQVEAWVSISSVVKVSQEDLTWLYPWLGIDQSVRRWLSMGPSLIVVTDGDQGLAGYRVDEKIQEPAVKVKVADTVGAGDTVGAILVEAIVKDGLDTLTGARLETMLKRAAKAAAITVSRVGANPPTSEELE